MTIDEFVQGTSAGQIPASVREPDAATPSAGYVAEAVRAVSAAATARAKVKVTAPRAAYVVPPADGATVYRVRVGKFSTRDQAEPVKAKLEKEELFKPWITR